MRLADTHPFDPAILESPFDYYRELRREAPVYKDPHTGLFQISTHALVLEAVKNHEVFSNRFAPAMGGGAMAAVAETDPELDELQKKSYPIVDTMLTADPPEHKRYRGLVNKAFTPRRVNGLEPGDGQAHPRLRRRLHRPGRSARRFPNTGCRCRSR